MNAKTDKALDEIFGGPPADFIKGRDALAKRLGSDGDEQAAKWVRALRKPSKAAAVVNALALDDPKPVKRYLGLADKLRKASSGRVDADRMRELAREDGELLEELVAKAGEVADDVSASTLDRVRETLQAAQVDSEFAQRVVAGRVEREERSASVGLENLLAAPQAPKRKRAGTKKESDSAEAKRDEAARKRRSEMKAALKEAQSEAREAAREVARAEQALAKAQRDRDAADRKAERAEAKLSKLG